MVGDLRRIVTFSPKVFIPLTRLCRDTCGYCTYRQPPQLNTQAFLEPEDVLAIARAGKMAGCREALFVLGERPEDRYAEARRWLEHHGHRSSVSYLAFVSSLVFVKTGLFPHSNAGNLSVPEFEALGASHASFGLMAEILSDRLLAPGGPHERAPSKRAPDRVEALRAAGEAHVPFTTGLLIGIGETWSERVRTLEIIGQLHARYGHVQEVIIQSFSPKPGTAMARFPEASADDLLATVSLARKVLGPEMSIQVPPNLAVLRLKRTYVDYLQAGVNDWGGVSPVTIDHVNPEAAWPLLEDLGQAASGGCRLRARYPVYPKYFLHDNGWVPSRIRSALLNECDAEGLVPDQVWRTKALSGTDLAQGDAAAHYRSRLDSRQSSPHG